MFLYLPKKSTKLKYKKGFVREIVTFKKKKKSDNSLNTNYFPVFGGWSQKCLENNLKDPKIVFYGFFNVVSVKDEGENIRVKLKLK